MAVTDNGTILLPDYYESIKSVSPDDKVLVQRLPCSPWAITVVDATTAVVTAWDKKLYILDINDQIKLSVRGKCQLEYCIWAMTHYDGNLVVTCTTEPRSTKMITTDGEEVWSVSKDGSGENLFSWPVGITSKKISGIDVIVVTDSTKHNLTLLDAETGRLIRTINLNVKTPYGITVDNDGNVYVCYRDNGEICVWSLDFEESKILLSRDQLGGLPQYIVYSGVNDSLYVSYESSPDKGNTVDCFRLV